MFGVFNVAPPTDPSPGMSTLGIENERLFHPPITLLIAPLKPSQSGENMFRKAPEILPGMPLTNEMKLFQDSRVLLSAVETTFLTTFIPFLMGVNTLLFRIAHPTLKALTRKSNPAFISSARFTIKSRMKFQIISSPTPASWNCSTSQLIAVPSPLVSVSIRFSMIGTTIGRMTLSTSHSRMSPST